jgi:hypothetical protein
MKQRKPKLTKAEHKLRSFGRVCDAERDYRMAWAAADQGHQFSGPHHVSDLCDEFHRVLKRALRYA